MGGEKTQEMPAPFLDPETEVTPSEKKSRTRLVAGVLAFFILLVAGGVFLWLRRDSSESVLVDEAIPLMVVESSQSARKPEEASRPADVSSDTGNYRSEHFRVAEIVVGGETEFLFPAAEAVPLEMSDIRGEAFSDKKGQEVKLVVSWKTNKLALSDIEYAKGVGQSGTTITETDYGLNHSLVIGNLDPASTYVYVITSRDRYGSEVRSDAYAVYTGSREVSLFDLIADAVGEVFGWAVKK